MARKRSVRFDPTCNVFVPINKGLTTDRHKVETKALWYSKKELKRIRLGIRCSLKNLAISGPTASSFTKEGGDASFQWRGLEQIQKGTMGSTTESRQILVQGVLSLQKLHKLMGIHRDDRALELFARGYNREATLRAQDAAKQDYADALQIYREAGATININTAMSCD